MIPEDILKERLGARKIGMICEECSVSGGSLINDLFRLVNHPDSGISYNALWILSHLSKQKRGVAEAKRSELVNILLSEKHCGKRRMILNILNNLNWEKSDIRSQALKTIF